MLVGCRRLFERMLSRTFRRVIDSRLIVQFIEGKPDGYIKYLYFSIVTTTSVVDIKLTHRGSILVASAKTKRK